MTQDLSKLLERCTSAPWTLETVKTSSGICHKVGPFPYRPDRQNHACIYHDYPNGELGPLELELRANAELISLAPELAKENIALRSIIARLGFCTPDASAEFMALIPDEICARMEKLETELRAALTTPQEEE